MEDMRHLLRGSLARSLGALRDEDRLAAAWTVACGRVMAGRGTVLAFTEGVVLIHVENPAWLQQMFSLRAMLTGELARISGLPVTAIHFQSGTPPRKEARDPC